MFFKTVLIALIGSYLVGKCVGSYAQMKSQFEALRTNASRVAAPQLRAFKGIIRNWLLDDVNEYGCWCYFDTVWGRGRSAPVDDLDAMCQVLHHGYECAIMDAKNEDGDDSCTPHLSTYQTISLSTMDENIQNECEVKNGGKNCASRTCAVESKFLRDVTQWSQDYTPDYSKFSTRTGTFVHDTGCLASAGVHSERRCCGEYPTRFPYRHLDGENACCETVTYKTQMHECCNGDTVVDRGTCV